MDWQPYSLHFKQTFSDGFRYLDNCGEFMLAAKKHDFMPGEVTVTGGSLTIPEDSFHANVGVTELSARQDFPPPDFNFFIEKCGLLAILASDHFGPLDLQSNGFAGKWFWRASSKEQALEKVLQFKQPIHDELAKAVAMPPSTTRLDLNFESGKSELHVVLHAVGFENVVSKSQAVPFRTTRDQNTRIQRLNAARRDFSFLPTYAVLLEVDLMELDPPSVLLENHFTLFKDKVTVLLKHFSKKP